MKKTKIVCTLGPATCEVDTLKQLMVAGMNVGRFNFSHGTYETHQSLIDNFKVARDSLGLPVAMLLDTKGPEIRIGRFENDAKINLEVDQEFALINDDILGDSTKVSISYKELYKDISVGGTILIDDGLVELRVTKIENKDIYCKVINAGTISNNKGVNVPNLKLSLPSITEKDINDIKFGIKNNFEYIGASFIRKADDVFAIRKLLEENNGSHIKIISKIENREGIDNFDEILKASDGIMVARGDLGVEIPMEEVPIIQKRFIKRCYRAGKPVITATQMLESMINNPRPTRAEVSDVANAIYDGTSAIMLSGESAMGKHPVECVKVMSRIAKSVENSVDYWKRFTRRDYNLSDVHSEFVMNHAKCTTAMHIDAKAIFTYTECGDTPIMISSFLPKCPVYAVTKNVNTYNQLSLCWGVHPMLFKEEGTITDMLHSAINFAKEQSLLKEGDFIVISGGPAVPYQTDSNKTNRMLGGVVEI